MRNAASGGQERHTTAVVLKTQHEPVSTKMQCLLLLKCRRLGPNPRVSDSAGLERDHQRISISDEASGDDGDNAGPGTMF